MEEKKENKKKQQALQKRANDSLSIDMIYKDFEPVNELVFNAQSEYEETGDLKGCLRRLAKAISELAG